MQDFNDNFDIMKTIYTTKISKCDVSMYTYVYMYGYAFGRALRYRAETWYRDMGRARGLRAYFRSDQTKGQRSSKGQVALEMPYGHQIWLKEPLTNSNAFQGSKVMQRSAGIAKFGHQIPLTEVESINEVKCNAGISWGQPGVKLLRNALW